MNHYYLDLTEVEKANLTFKQQLTMLGFISISGKLIDSIYLDDFRTVQSLFNSGFIKADGDQYFSLTEKGLTLFSNLNSDPEDDPRDEFFVDTIEYTCEPMPSVNNQLNHLHQLAQLGARAFGYAFATLERRYSKDHDCVVWWVNYYDAFNRLRHDFTLWLNIESSIDCMMTWLQDNQIIDSVVYTCEPMPK